MQNNWKLPVCNILTFFVTQVIGMAALACGMISVGSSNGDVTSTILQTMMERSEADLKETYSKFLALGLALTYLGKGFKFLALRAGSNIFYISGSKISRLGVKLSNYYSHIEKICIEVDVLFGHVYRNVIIFLTI
jgi:hypothetical protein